MTGTLSYPREGLKTARLLMVLSSLSPLFVLWAIRGNRLIPNAYFTSACVLLAFLPSAFLWWRVCRAQEIMIDANLRPGPRRIIGAMSSCTYLPCCYHFIGKRWPAIGTLRP